MLRKTPWLALVLLAAATAACTNPRRSAAGFRLPDNGDVERGRLAFVSLECNSCHEVKGVELPKAVPRLKNTVILGGRIPREMTDGHLVTSIIHPSYTLSGYPRGDVAVNGKSRMPDYTERITARQLTDMVAFLQAHYETYMQTRELPVGY